MVKSGNQSPRLPLGEDLVAGHVRFSKILTAPTEVLGRDIRANDNALHAA